MHLAVALHLHLDSGGQGVGDRHADPVQTARECVGGIAFLLVEFAPCVQPGVGQYHDRHAFFRVQTDRNAAAVVCHRDRTVAMHGHRDLLGLTGQGFVSRVVDHFLNDVGRRIGAGVHARPFADRFESFQDAE